MMVTMITMMIMMVTFFSSFRQAERVAGDLPPSPGARSTSDTDLNFRCHHDLGDDGGGHADDDGDEHSVSSSLRGGYSKLVGNCHSDRTG